VFETAETTDGKPVRHVFIAIPQQGPVRYVLQAEISLLPYWATRNGLVILLTLGFGTILLVAWIGSGWLAKKVLTPFEVLSAAAETMSESDLGKRFTLDSPYQEFCRLTRAFNSVMDRFLGNGEVQRGFLRHRRPRNENSLDHIAGQLVGGAPESQNHGGISRSHPQQS
jgi:hypothetical protein